MRIVDRYLLKDFLLSIAFCLALFLVLFVIIDSFNNLNEFLRHGVTLTIILSYYFYLVPSILVQVIPVAVLVAILFVLGNFNRHNEITALKASGVSAFHIVGPYLMVGLLISFLVLLINETTVPKSMVNSTAIMEGLILKGKRDLNERAIKNVTLHSKSGQIIFAREMEVQTQTLRDIVILEDGRGQIVKSKLVAKRAHYENGQWIFYDAIKYRLNHFGDIIGEPAFRGELTLELPEKPGDFIKESSQIEFMSSKQLKETILQFKGPSKKLIRRLWVDYHFKIAFPFISLVVILIGAPLALKIERGKTIAGIGTSLAVVLLFYAFDSILLALGKGGYLPPMLSAWLTSFLFAVVGIYLIKNTT